MASPSKVKQQLVIAPFCETPSSDEPDTPVKGSKRQLPKDVVISRTNLIAKFDGDFSELSQREGSTSTPYTTRPLPKAPPPETPGSNDSGICDAFASSSDSSDLFLHPSVLTNWKQPTSPVKRRASLPACSPYPSDCCDFVCGSYESEIASLPKISPLSYFDDTCDHSDAHSQASADSAVDLSFSSCDFTPSDLSQSSDIFDLEEAPLPICTQFDSSPLPPDENSLLAFEKILEQFSPRQPDRLIGRKMGRSHVDLIVELHDRAMHLVLGGIFSVLTDVELCRVASVSSQWRLALKECKSAQKRKTKYLKFMSFKHKEVKENFQPKPVLSTRSVNASQPSPTKCSSAQKFWKEAKKLTRDQSLSRCPRCKCPSRVDRKQERAWCSETSCGHDYCTRCLLPFHQSQPCRQRKEVTGDKHTIGSSKSKRNLRRL